MTMSDTIFRNGKALYDAVHDAEEDSYSHRVNRTPFCLSIFSEALRA
jgi:hypothetical protein